MGRAAEVEILTAVFDDKDPGAVALLVDDPRASRAAGKRLQSELERLAIHGLGHPFGHDHKRRTEADVMFALERKLRRLPVGR